ncbi:ABC transporter ATP-binding protein [Devosia sp.]|uniref:ABC transporter ATP-binding protein n=1 Tax=Devosia sp. TaxID=1871048 RepID=UPI002EEBCF89
MLDEAIISLSGVTKRYGSFVAVDDLDLTVRPGEFLSFLGPSGCGKTTTLRMIAGFIRPDEGRIMLAGRDVTHLPPNRRDLSFVFQNYALWPHMTVAENIGFGLKLKGVSRPDIDRRVAEVLAMTDLSGLEPRFPRELSGGQQQRVAVARALALGRSVLLMDEPLSNLDRKLRIDMRKELKELQGRLNVTTIYVTHDQEEALSMSDRVAVMDRGRIVCLAAPEDVYRHPPNQFAAEFVGNVNFFEGTVEDAGDGRARFRSADGLAFEVTRAQVPEDGPVRLMIRPEWIELRPAGTSGLNTHPMQVDFMEYVGASRRISARTDTGRDLLIQMHDIAPARARVGDRLCFYVAPQNLVAVK